MNKSIILSIVSLFLFCAGIRPSGQAQTDNELLAQLVAENEEAVNALVLYPEDVRVSILEATLYPEALIRLESIQSKTSASFRELLETYPQSTQEMIWDLTRYPDLIHRMVKDGRPSTSKLNAVLQDYPEVIHDRARTAANDYYYQLVAIDELNREAFDAFEALLSGYPETASRALRQLIELPEVLSILTDNIRLTVLVGDLYRNDPEWVIYKADSLSLEVARKNAEEIEDWKASLQDDPDVVAELKSSTETFEEEYGYDDEYYSYEGDDLYYEDRTEELVVRNYYYYNYPYWFGYPTWYYYPRWRPYPVWYESGFYIYPGGSIVVIGLPSFYFTHWYFYHPVHHHHWPHLSSHFVNHYYGHRSVGSSISVSVNHWRDQNREVITDKWMKDDGRLVERFREYGSFETNREKYNRDHPKQPVSQQEYLEKNSRRYPALKTAVDTRKTEPDARDRRTIPSRTEPAVKDRKTVPPRTEPAAKDRKTVPPRTEPAARDRKTVPPRTEPAVKQPRTDQKPTVPKRKNENTDPEIRVPANKQAPKVDKGKEYHKNTWERSKTTSPSPRVTPKVRTQSPKARTTTPKVTKPKTATKKNTTKRKN
jgi:hypothetical protein